MMLKLVCSAEGFGRMFHILTEGSSTGYALFFKILLLPPQTFQFLISRGVLRRTSSGPAEI